MLITANMVTLTQLLVYFALPHLQTSLLHLKFGLTNLEILDYIHSFFFKVNYPFLKMVQFPPLLNLLHCNDGKKGQKQNGAKFFHAYKNTLFS